MAYKKSAKILMLVVLVLALSGFTYAFAATNTVPATYAGDGSGTISGYTVTNVHYDLNATTPTTIDSVTFTLDAAATTVKIKLVASGSTWYSCSNTTGTNWSCTTTGASVSAADSLEVVATN
jgi:hypothetical protein